MRAWLALILITITPGARAEENVKAAEGALGSDNWFSSVSECATASIEAWNAQNSPAYFTMTIGPTETGSSVIPYGTAVVYNFCYTRTPDWSATSQRCLELGAGEDPPQRENICTEYVCDPDAVWDVATHSCVYVPECTVDTDCSDPRTCMVPTCNDSTQTCEFAFDDSACSCDALPLPDVSVETGPHSGTVEIGCPVVGGSAGIKAEASGTSQFEAATCANNCTLGGSVEATGTFTGELCGASLSANLTGTFSATERGCVECTDSNTCSETCDMTSPCLQTTVEGEGAVSLSRRVGKDASREFNFGGGRVDMKCSAELSGSVGGGYGRTETSGNPSCVACDDCVTDDIDFDLGAGATGTCLIDIRVPGRRYKVISEDAVALDLSATGHHQLQSGDCGDGYCASARADVKGRAQTPQLEIPSIRWFKPAGNWGCSAEFDTCLETNSCEACACGDGTCSDQDTRFSCTVTP